MLGFFAVVFIIATSVSLASLKQASEVLESWSDGHELKEIESLNHAFRQGKTAGTTKIFLVWGLKGIDRQGASKYDFKNKGVPIWDDTFDMSSAAAQNYLLSVCSDLRTNYQGTGGSGALVLKDNWPKCIMDDFKT